ncbi:MAG: hypothetical protein JWN56_483 [Sphingobacteriales bacterium]|nr:hypothetical protein [Sphingobacteriales bacterium]
MNKHDLIETLILNGVFRQNGFSKSTIAEYSADEEIVTDVFAEIGKIKSYSELIADRARTMNNTAKVHIISLLKKQYAFSNSLVYDMLYDYGMLMSR